MWQLAIKTVISAAVIVAVSEVSRRSPTVGGLIAALPFTSVMAMTWLYLDTKDVGKVSALSLSIFWFVLPSLLFLLAVPWLLQRLKLGFPLAMPLACLLLIAASAGLFRLLERLGVKF
jgi:uncharacterized membrane protein (GlpM family)